MQQNQMGVNIDLKATTPVLSPNGNQIFGMGVILRRVSKFLTGQAEDGIIPIQVFYDLKTQQILTDMLPKELREEFENKTIIIETPVSHSNQTEGQTEKGKIVEFNSFPKD